MMSQSEGKSVCGIFEGFCYLETYSNSFFLEFCEDSLMSGVKLFAVHL